MHHTRAQDRASKTGVASDHTSSRGRLKPPLRFMYCRYLRCAFFLTASILQRGSPTSLPAVLSKAEKPIISAIIFASRSSRGGSSISSLFVIEDEGPSVGAEVSSTD